jgi:arylsulfatase A-like enzyme
MMLDRREFVKLLGTGASGLWASYFSCVSKKSKIKPNIIFIMADDLGWGDLGCYGQKMIKTPHIDKLAEEGLRFTQCYAGGAVCAPSRSVLMTGQHLGHTRVRGNRGKTGGVEVRDNGPLERRIPLELEDVTIAELLKEAGYVTGMTGKWGLGEPGSSGAPTRQGFDEWFGYLNQRRAHTYYPPYLWRNDTKVILEGNRDDKRQEYSHDMFTDFALDFLEANQDRPFFLYLPYTIPHYTLESPSPEPYQDEPWEEHRKTYAAMVTRMDRDVGRIMSFLKGNGLDHKTIVFFCSDNGGLPDETEFFGSTGPFRGNKGDVYEGGLRVQMIVRYPGKGAKVTTSDLPWYFADVVPTLMDLIGKKPPVNIDGVSVLPTILGREQDLKNRFMYWEHHNGQMLQAVRWGKWKAVRLSKNAPLELYDVESDVAEKSDISASFPDIVTEIEAYLKTARTESVNWPV